VAAAYFEIDKMRVQTVAPRCNIPLLTYDKQDGQSDSFFFFVVDNVPASAHEYDQAGRTGCFLLFCKKRKEK
jgi:hypothetical protein